jgi:UDP-N-acetylmuramate--alanine ligase
MSIFQNKKIHFVGVGGIGNSALAQILGQKGNKVSGSDQKASELTRGLEASGIRFSEGHSPDNLPEGCDYLIHSPAIPEDNPELTKAKELKIPTLTYPEALGKLSEDYFTIAVAGTHGKSTTTAILSLILEQADLDPTVVIGTKIREFDNQNFRIGKSEYLVIEACEYKRSFKSFKPDILIITNLEPDHLDYFADEEDYFSAFKDLASSVKENGKIITNKEDPNSRKITATASDKTIEWGSEDIQYQPGVPGKFNQENATGAAFAAKQLEVAEETIQTAISNFKGTWRRMEEKKPMGDTRLIDDYGHHPTEVKATLRALRETNPEARILCVFQPHQYSRTKMLLEEFSRAFNDANEVIIPNIYQVRDSESDIKAINTNILVEEIVKHQSNVRNGHGLEETSKYIKENHQNFDIIITMGAGDITKIHKLLEE